MAITLSDRIRAAYRALKHGPALVSMGDAVWGHATSDYEPPEYADYQATSNGVYTCTSLRANTIAALPLRLYKGTGDEREEVTTGALYELIHNVNPFWTLNRLLRMTELSLCLFGDCYWFLDRGMAGRSLPREIWWARPDKVRPVLDKVDYISGYLYQPSNGAQPIHYTPDEVVWMPHPNIKDEFAGMSPMAAARLAADTSSAAMKANRNLFTNGLMPGGFIQPAARSDGNYEPWTPEQRNKIADDMQRKFKGTDAAHKWGVFRQRVDFIANNITPHDAAFMELLKWTLEDICRAYTIPLDVVGGQRTYENVESALKMLYMLCIKPECEFLASELTEKLLPKFGTIGVDSLEFDFSGVDVLQEDRAEVVAQMQVLAGMGVPLNTLLSEFMPQLMPEGGKGYEWGDTWWAPLSVAPADIELEKAQNPQPIPPQLTAGPAADEEPEPDDDNERSYNTRAIEFGSDIHVRLWTRFIKREERWEGKVADNVTTLFMRQRDSAIDRLANSKATKPDDLTNAIFRKATWVKASRETLRPVLRAIMADLGQLALDDLLLDLSFNVDNVAARRAIETQAQKFAVEITDTSWDRLRGSLSEGMGAGESMGELSTRVDDLFTGWYRKTGDEELAAKATRAFTIARTETSRASNEATLLGWKQSDVVGTKTWLSAMDPPRARDAHMTLHGTTIPLDEEFESPAGGHGQAPGQMGTAQDDINCRCTMTAGIRF